MKILVKRAVVVGLGCVLSALASGCSSSDSGSSGTPVPLDQFPQQFAAALCDNVEPCCKVAAIPYTAATCKNRVTADYTDQVTSAGAHAKYDANAAGACLEKMKAELKACTSLDTLDVYTACSGVFVGTLPLGAACTSSFDCASGGVCQFDQTGVTNGGTCVSDTRTTESVVHGKAGDSCLGSCATVNGNVECDERFQNDPNATTYTFCYTSEGLGCTGVYDPTTGTESAPTCTALAPLGASCANALCVDGAYCDASSTSTSTSTPAPTPTCMAVRDSGPCSFQAPACGSKSYCSQTGNCTPLKPDGYACSSSSECAKGQCSGADSASGTAGICGPGSVASKGTCAGDFSGI